MGQRHILLLDPNDGNRRNLAFLLHLAGYRVTVVNDGHEALNRVAICLDPEHIDLLVVCLPGPTLDMPELLDGLRQKQLPALLVDENLGLPRQTGNSSLKLRCCRRDEIIETLATLWPSESATLSPSPIASINPQEH